MTDIYLLNLDKQKEPSTFDYVKKSITKTQK